MEKTDSPIYRWLSRVTGSGQAIGASGAGVLAGEPYTCPPLTEISDYVDGINPAHPLKSFPVALESTELAPQVRWPHSKKRMRDSPTRKEHPRDEPRSEKPVNDYQRKPRHRTREDRYEYKIAGSSRKNASEAPEQKTKRQRRSRKQAMNDGFHASNVARNRLTLPNAANMGIFSRGRASSSIKLRDVSDLTFSETNLLSRKAKGNGRAPTTTVNEPREKKQTKRVHDSFDLQFRDASEQRDIHLTNVSPGGLTRYLVGSEKIDATGSCDRLSLHNLPDLAVQTKSTTAPPRTGEFQDQVAKNAHNSRSATPYTWSETSRATALNFIVEDDLLKILHVGLFSESQPGPDIPVDSKKYYTLQDLKLLLEARRASWLSNSSDVEATFQRPSGFDLPQRPVTQPPNIVEASSSPTPKFNLTLLERHRSPAISKNFEQDVIRGPRHPRNYSENGPCNLSPFQSPQIVNTGMAEADEFFRALDAQFCAIMEPSREKLEHTVGSPEAQHPQQSLEAYQHNDILPKVRNTSTYDSVDLKRHGRSDYGNTYPISLAISSHYAQAELATYPSSGRTLPMPPKRDARNEQSLDNIPVTKSWQPFAGLTKMTANEHATLPTGFWRQNKLY